MGSVQKELDAGRPLTAEHDHLCVARKRNERANS